jgi:hypothetical protein
MLAMARRRSNPPGFHFFKERAMSKHARKNPSAGNQPQPRHEQDDAESNDFERNNRDIPIDDPGDALRSSKSELEGDGEETES